MRLEQLAAIVGVCLFVFILISSVVKADVSCHKEYYIDGVAYINDTCVLNDEELERDVYGNETGSGPKDMILDEIKGIDGNPIEGTEGLGSIDEICNDPGLQQYFSDLSSLPPQEFVDHLKALGYDDESHVTMIWTICQDDYVSSHESTWARDESGVDSLTVAGLIGNAIDWLLGLNPLPSKNQEIIGRKLDSYFASDRDVYYLNARINELQLRVEALERTLEETQAEAYCQGKLGLMLDYNMRWVKCGDTTYHNHLTDPTTGEDVVVGITPIENGGSEESEDTEIELESEDNTIECSDVGKPKNSVSFCTSYTGNYWCGFSDRDDWYMKNCIRRV